ncbi:MAG TPA: asparaginase domain-containing protein [Rhodothermales bacterium]
MHVKIFTTGGTIDKVYFDAESEFKVGPPQIDAILHDAKVKCDYAIETLLRKDSLDLTEADRALIREHVARDPIDRVLITHGTDTMVETARVLQDVKDKTIVLVGSLSPARFKNTDALFNIGFAFAAVQLLPPGVYVAMHGCVYDPLRVRKNRERNEFEEDRG